MIKPLVHSVLEIFIILSMFATIAILAWFGFVLLIGWVTRKENTLTGSGPSDRRPRGSFRLIRWFDPWYDWPD